MPEPREPLVLDHGPDIFVRARASPSRVAATGAAGSPRPTRGISLPDGRAARVYCIRMEAGIAV